MHFHRCLVLCLLFLVVYGRNIGNLKKGFLTKEFISKINNAQSTWKAEPNKFVLWSKFSIKRLMGVLTDHYEQVKQLDILIHDVPNDVPDNFDARDEWPNCPTIKEVRDQGRLVLYDRLDIDLRFNSSCGSCWAFGAVEAMSDRICIASKGAQNTHISAEDVLGMFN
jgi:cathepsin B